MNPPANPAGHAAFDLPDALDPTADDHILAPYATVYSFEPPVSLGYWDADINPVPPTATFQYGHEDLPTGPTPRMPSAYRFSVYRNTGTACSDLDPSHRTSPSSWDDQQLLFTTVESSANLGNTESPWWMGFGLHGYPEEESDINYVFSDHDQPTGQPAVALDAGRTNDSMLPVNSLATSGTSWSNPFPEHTSGSSEVRSEQSRRRHSTPEVERSLTRQGYERQAPDRTVDSSPGTRPPPRLALRRASTSTIETGSGMSAPRKIIKR